MNIAILGGGLAGVSLAYFLQNDERVTQITIIEKEDVCGGLCRSYTTGGVKWDIGPHIIFSKDKETLSFMLDILGGTNKLRRSNRILHKGARVLYPFENDLSKLPEDDLKLCVNTFLNNPYESYAPDNMLQFFLATFGEGITNLYLRPYNEKIWKFDPAFLDLQMVGRIPKPPKEDILKSAAGETIDGYTHQLYFDYPKENGIAALIQAFMSRLNSKVNIVTNAAVRSVSKTANGFFIDTDGGGFPCEKVISTIPVNELCQIYGGTPDNIKQAGAALRYNSIAIIIVQLSRDLAGDNFAFMTADKDVIFHRVSKIDFLGDAYHNGDTVTYMAEVTYRKNDIFSQMPDSELLKKTLDGLHKIGFMDDETEVLSTQIKRFEYAYVMYDQLHKQHMGQIREFFKTQGVYLSGRFGDFEYLNMDGVIAGSKKLAGGGCYETLHSYPVV